MFDNTNTECKACVDATPLKDTVCLASCSDVDGPGAGTDAVDSGTDCDGSEVNVANGA